MADALPQRPCWQRELDDLAEHRAILDDAAIAIAEHLCTHRGEPDDRELETLVLAYERVRARLQRARVIYKPLTTNETIPTCGVGVGYGGGGSGAVDVTFGDGKDRG